MRLITVAIHTYDYALSVKSLLESEGIRVTLQNVNLEQPEVSSGVRVRIPEADLPLALRIIENQEIFRAPREAGAPQPHMILVPTDFSDHAHRAAAAAIRLAARHGCEVTLLYSFMGSNLAADIQLTDNLTFELPEIKGLEAIRKEAETLMRSYVHKIKAEMKAGKLPVVKCHGKVVQGVPEDAIVDYAKLNPPYLVVMGTRAYERKEREMIGSVTAEVLDESRFTVLTVPENYDINSAGAPANILFFSNLDQDDILAMDALYRYFPDAHSRVTIVNVPRRLRMTDRGRSAMALSEYCRKKFEHFTFESVPVPAKDAMQELERLQAEHRFDLIVVPNRRKNAFSRLLNPGLAHKIVFEADVPMLVIPV